MSAPDRRLSPLRVVVVLAVVVGLAGLGYLGWDHGSRAVEEFTSPRSDTAFAPYADVTLQPSFAFQDPDISPAPTTVLGFVVPDREDPCTPTWGTYYDLDGAASELDLDRRIARVREGGGDVIVAFGGVVNSELAVACTDPEALTAAYGAVIERYAPEAIDLDIEGSALDDDAANARRAAAIRSLQQRASDERPLRVWLTLPVTPDGLLPAGTGVIDAMLAGGVDLAGVNLMTMNYGASRPDGMSMGEAARAALRAAHGQLAAAYRAAGEERDSERLWAQLGATPMIGRNDVEGETFSVGDARGLADFAEEVGLGRISMWAANRDEQCGEQDTGGWQVLPTCTGVEQKRLEFTRTFLARLDGQTEEEPDAAAAVSSGGRVGDDPAASPYPIWRAGRTYMEGEKVVWQRTVYAAKWWTQGDRPDQPAENEWDTPWRTLGPVLPGDSRTKADPEAAPPRWSSDVVYLRGDRVRLDGFLYGARWRTQAERPELDPDLPDAAAWVVIGRAPADVPPVFESYPEWEATTAYAHRDRVSLGPYVFEARGASLGARPDPAPAQPGRSRWKLVGTRTDVAPAAETPG